MPHSLRAKIKGLRYKGIITDKDCDRLCKALDNENVLDKLRAELHATAEMHDDGDYYLRDEWIEAQEWQVMIMQIVIEIPDAAYTACKAIKDVEDDGSNLLMSCLMDAVANGTPFKQLGEEMRITQKAITDEKVLIGFNMAVALCNKYIGKRNKPNE